MCELLATDYSQRCSAGSRTLDLSIASPMLYCLCHLYLLTFCTVLIMVFIMPRRSTKGIVTVVDTVASVANANDFPGIYADHLDETCWSDDSKRVVLSSLWRSRMELIMVHVETGQVTRLSNDPAVGSWNLLDIRKDLMLVACSSPSQPPYLVIGKLPSVGEPLAIKWLRLDSEPEPLPQVLVFLSSGFPWVLKVLRSIF